MPDSDKGWEKPSHLAVEFNEEPLIYSFTLSGHNSPPKFGVPQGSLHTP